MSGRVLRFEGSVHQQAQRLLPWWVNGTLEGSESESVAQHLAHCEQCRRDVEELRQLRETYAEAALPLPQPAFARVRRRLQTQTQDSPRPPRWWHGREAWTRVPAWMRGVVLAQALAIVLLGGALLGTGPDRDRSVANYRTLGHVEAPADATAGPRMAHLVVMFAPATNQAQMRDLLRANEARIVAGPNDAGAYVIAVPAARVAGVRAALRATPQVVLAESLDPAA